MPRNFLHESVHDSVIFQSEDGQHRVCGGFVCVSRDLIRFEKEEEVSNDEGEWEGTSVLSSPMNLLRARMVREELEEVVRHAEHPYNLGWRLVKLHWEPTIDVMGMDGVRVGLDGAKMLLRQLEKAITDAEMIEGYQAEAKRARRKTSRSKTAQS